jgi:hypothetical protein
MHVAQLVQNREMIMTARPLPAAAFQKKMVLTSRCSILQNYRNFEMGETRGKGTGWEQVGLAE